MKLICAQEDHAARTGQSPSEAFLPIKTADTLVVELRKWLDHVGHGMPYFVGWKARKVRTQRRWLVSLFSMFQSDCGANTTHGARCFLISLLFLVLRRTAG